MAPAAMAKAIRGLRPCDIFYIKRKYLQLTTDRQLHTLHYISELRIVYRTFFVFPCAILCVYIINRGSEPAAALTRVLLRGAGCVWQMLAT